MIVEGISEWQRNVNYSGRNFSGILARTSLSAVNLLLSSENRFLLLKKLLNKFILFY